MDLSSFMSLIKASGINTGGLDTNNLSSLTDLTSITNSITGTDPNALWTMVQGMDSSFDNLYGGAITADSIISGQGLDSSGLPTTPDSSVYQKLQDMETNYATKQQDYLSDVQDQINIKKEMVFTSYHYEFDANGSPAKDDQGKVKLYEGCESANQKQLRLDWESQQKKDLSSKQNQETQTFLQTSQDKLSAAQKAYNANPLDAEVANTYQAVYTEIQTQQEELTRTQTKEMLLLNTDFLPADVSLLPKSSTTTAAQTTPAAQAAETAVEGEAAPAVEGEAVPAQEAVAAPKEVKIPEGTKMLSSVVEEKWQGYDNLLDQQKAEETASPEYQEINNYNQAVQAFVADQKIKYTTGDGTEAIMDVDTLKTLISGGATFQNGTQEVAYNAETIQNLITGTDVFQGFGGGTGITGEGLELAGLEIPQAAAKKTAEVEEAEPEAEAAQAQQNQEGEVNPQA